MSKKRINKIKTKQKQKQKQKQIQIVNVNIHKPTRRPREAPSEPRRNVQQLPTPQYIYTSQIDSLVPQMFNKQGQQESMPTLNEQINKVLNEKVDKLISQYNTPIKQPTPIQEEIKQPILIKKQNKQKMIKEYIDNKPQPTPIYKKEPQTLKNIINISPPVDIFTSPNNDIKPNIPPNYYYDRPLMKPNITSQSIPIIYKSEPETLKTVIEKPRKNISKEKIVDYSNIYNPKEKQNNNSDLTMQVQEAPASFQEPGTNNSQLVIYTSLNKDIKPNKPPNYYYEDLPIKPNIISKPNIYKSEPETLKTVIEKPRTNIKKEKVNEYSNIYNPKEIRTNNIDTNYDTSKNITKFQSELKELKKEQVKKQIDILEHIQILENKVKELNDERTGLKRGFKAANTKRINANKKKIEQLNNEFNELKRIY